MRLKDHTVTFDGISPELLSALAVVETLHQELTFREAVITSLNDGNHRPGSRHYEGYAADIRVWYTDALDATWNFAQGLRDRLGEDYDVVFGTPGHTNHVHVEFDPT